MAKPPFFIIGSPRSGTTMLRLMLTCHSQLVIPPECGFAVWLYDKYHQWSPRQIEPFVADVLVSRKFDTWKLGDRRLHTALRARGPTSYSAAAAAVYETYGANVGRTGSRWGDKNNFHTHHIDTIRRIFPSAVFIHLLRDGRDVACSYRSLGRRRITGRYAPQLPIEIGAIASHWSGNVAAATAALAELDSESVEVVRFENLVNNTEQTLRRICGFLGESFEEAMLRFHEHNRERELEPPSFLAWKERSLEPPNPAMVGIYKRDLSAAEVRTFEAVAGGALRLAGYPLHSG